MPLIELSPGEVYDRLTILELKAARVPGGARQHPAIAAGLRNAELALAGIELGAASCHVDDLRRINAQLWDVEDQVRRLLATPTGAAGPAFAEAAARVPVLNDARAGAKRAIDRHLCYAAPEVKHYA